MAQSTQALLESLDLKIAEVLSDWGIVTTLLALVILAFVAYPILYPDEPDTHPLLLARQSSAAPVRNKNESAAYRSPEVPYGYPLKTGLNVKDPGAPRWASGKDGDVRDIWREVQRGGSQDADGKTIPSGSIMTVLGKEVVEHNIADITKEINVLGKHFADSRVKRVAIYLPNSVEYLTTIFACAFYGISPILLPYNLPHQKAFELITATSADALVCEAGNLPLEDLAKQCPNLRLLTWVVEKTSRHVDWNGSPTNSKNNLNVSVWHELVELAPSSIATAPLPANQAGEQLGNIITVWQPADPQSKPEITTFTHANLISAVAALISALPLRQRIVPSDLLLPADSFTNTYILCYTLAALYLHANLAITSVAGPAVDFHLATRSVAPTIILASPETLITLHAANPIVSPLAKLAKLVHSQTMEAGRLPSPHNLLSRFLPPVLPSSSSLEKNKPGHLRLILTATNLPTLTTTSPQPPAALLTSPILSDLRLLLRGTRIVHALAAPPVAGALAQSNVFDYRRDFSEHGLAHFGVPLSHVEVLFAAAKDGDGEGDEAVSGEEGKGGVRGEMVVRGPGVAVKGRDGRDDGEVRLGVKGKVRGDGCLALV
ncbi:acetyl-CoA synthetase-like protein [Hortaea werneckii]|nr:acetyl-CoA synthetase-like protein [Hortaea werneckii]KAI7308331.1 acetyl-CoA synthetase-like protein [Hortaea werneckii]